MREALWTTFKGISLVDEGSRRNRIKEDISVLILPEESLGHRLNWLVVLLLILPFDPLPVFRKESSVIWAVLLHASVDVLYLLHRVVLGWLLMHVPHWLAGLEQDVSVETRWSVLEFVRLKICSLLAIHRLFSAILLIPIHWHEWHSLLVLVDEDIMEALIGCNLTVLDWWLHLVWGVLQRLLEVLIVKFILSEHLVVCQKFCLDLILIKKNFLFGSIESH